MAPQDETSPRKNAWSRYRETSTRCRAREHSTAEPENLLRRNGPTLIHNNTWTNPLAVRWAQARPRACATL
jgi:hypothetical protein